MQFSLGWNRASERNDRPVSSSRLQDRTCTGTTFNLALLQQGGIPSSLLQVVSHYCQVQYDLLLTEREFQQLHHLVIGQLPRADQETFQHPASGTETMPASLAGYLRYPVLQHFLLVLVVPELLFGLF